MRVPFTHLLSHAASLHTEETVVNIYLRWQGLPFGASLWLTLS